ncbi:radical SAM superfamily protein [[Clostridium] sordellii]|uniref:Radical SAM superfamily protein n=1 Tax=Paraclostridium sordellii TaxID=1505 RepID=A0A9P1L0A3_PARSO|nr:radical SAM domain protein [Paeniclostridium sordellii]EPZ56828.1 putative radical SAM domain protein [[Clostridium] sordellii VPI 9048] [Paeniclostridium sordellii VPI 9048]MBS6024390.1 radical SAM protein [Paeniclostridium sordellii]MBX9181620.1 radical SAM protein [Paeniclostridium sordellii]MCR1848428.1 radical SAM protein [Paeniclostridium sordellii]MDU2687668.1 radical SAM protein [Paeniclostridium sordellii]
MDRYNEIKNKNQREIVLLKGFPCIWGKCSFCDYTLDNDVNEEEMNKLNFEVLENVTGKYKVLEVINSGSCFELPKKTLDKIKEVIKKQGIQKLFLESHWCYRNRLDEMREFFGIEIIFKIGVESFDYNFRNNFLNKNAKFKTVEELKSYFDSPCMMVGIKGQTKEMIDKDIEIVLNNFKHATINVFVDNTSKIKRDNDLVRWFKEKYAFLDENDYIEVLYNNTDFGVGD